jgi:hydrogenase maturation protein HypF
MSARSILVIGVVQGVGFRPFVFRLARAHTLAGWVLNGEEGVEIFLEGADAALDRFERDLQAEPPPAAHITRIRVVPAKPAGLKEFVIRESRRNNAPTVRISPDLPVCSDCLRELFDPADPRFEYPYINCTNCGPRYTIVLALPYDRACTTMKDWPMDQLCAAQYHDPADRRFHAQPVACPHCGPHYTMDGASEDPIGRAVRLLSSGSIVAMKGLGGYHLACDARNAATVRTLRERKFRKEKPFALMARDVETARRLVELSPAAQALLTGVERPIVLCPAKIELAGVAPDNDELGVMLPYTPLHHLLFAKGAPDVLVMTSANRSDEPICYQDDEAAARLSGIADAFLIGERPIARRLDDSVARVGAFGPAILRRARGYAPAAAARLPVEQPILAAGADLKNTITLAVDGQAFVSQYIGDLEHYEACLSFEQTIKDLVSMYDVRWEDVLVAHDCHPQFRSTMRALELPAARRIAVQHHRAHIASVLAEREAWHERVTGVSFDGTGYGDDGTVWGGEIFIGSVAEGFRRVAHLREAKLPGGDAAARDPVQAAAGFVSAVPFPMPARFEQARRMVEKNVRTFTTTSAGRLFDTAAALLGFTRPITFEGQAAMWLEHLAARSAEQAKPYPFPFDGEVLDYRPLLEAVVQDRTRGRDAAAIARDFHRGLAQGIYDAVLRVSESTVAVLSGGVFQNEILLRDLQAQLTAGSFEVWTNHAVPANDGGISLGQAALAAFGRGDEVHA